MLAQVSPAVASFAAASAPARVSDPYAALPLSVIARLAATVSQGAFVTYAVIAAHASPSGYCWLGRTRLSRLASLSPNYVSQVLSELEAAGFLTRKRRADGLLGFQLTVVPLFGRDREAGAATPQRSEPLRHSVHRTDQGTDEKPKERAPAPPVAPEPAPEAPPLSLIEDPPPAPEPLPAAPAVEYRIEPKAPLPPDWRLPEDWRGLALRMRPDLSDTLETVAANFFDHHASKGKPSSCWLAEWRRWVRREYAPRSAVQAPGGARWNKPVEKRYPTPEQENAPEPPHIAAARDLSEQNRLALLRRHGIDPATGFAHDGTA